MAQLNEIKFGFSDIFVTELDQIADNNIDYLSKLQGSKILILGGTGFVGKWLTASLLHGQRVFNQEFEITVVTRNRDQANSILKPAPESNIRFVEHDFVKGHIVGLGHFDYCIHGATPSVPATGSLDENKVSSATKNGTLTLVDIIEAGSPSIRVLNLSSGAVLGAPDLEKGFITESRSFGYPRSSYARVKIEAEEDLDRIQSAHGYDLTHSRLFAFVGPHMSLHDHFAVGNFMSNFLNKDDILVKGNPETTRSYMYPTDLASCLLRLLTHRGIQRLNIGSRIPLSMREIAGAFAKLESSLVVDFSQNSERANHYVPDVTTQSNVLGIGELVSFEESIKRWAKWLQAKEL